MSKPALKLTADVLQRAAAVGIGGQPLALPTASPGLRFPRGNSQTGWWRRVIRRVARRRGNSRDEVLERTRGLGLIESGEAQRRVR